mmetsp:Transcript_11662/g.25284  ORF Transcript_11662/g.25284 Transcript_11662/m.25284 type:complete len:349 (-) Transcript_11662:170-1216(-)
MAATMLLSLLVCFLFSAASAFQHHHGIVLPKSTLRSASPPSLLLRMSSGNLDGDTSGKGLRVTVVGGSGFVGSRVCKILVDCGAEVTSVSKSGQPPAWAEGEEFRGSVDWKAVDLLSGNDAELDAAIGDPDAIVSTVGVVGTDYDELLKGNGDANAAVFQSAKRKGFAEASRKTSRIAYVSVSDEVMACEDNWLPEFFGGYFEGKRIAEAAALDALGGNPSYLTIVKPSFIYGGDSFGLFPPRVNYAYGSGVEQLLSFGLIKAVADITPGLIKVALRPPVSVDSVASACAAAALGKEAALGKVLDGTKAINAVTEQPDATGLSEAFEWTREGLAKAYEWARNKIEEPK